MSIYDKNKGSINARFISLLIIFSIICSVTILQSPITANAYADTLGNVISATANGDNVTIIVDNGMEPGDDILELQVCESDILRVNYRPNGIASSPSTPIIDPTRVWGSVGASIDVNSDPITISTSDMRIEIKRNPCRMTVKKPDGTVLFWEPDNAGVFHDGVRFQRPAGQNMYGLHGYACFDENGELLRNNTTAPAKAGQQGNSGGPFMWSTAGYGLLIDSDGGYPVLESSTNKMEFYYGDMIEEGRRYYKENVEYYIMFGDPENIMENYSRITGQAPMMPKWSMGFSNYEWGINQTELYNIVDTYRAKDIPIDSYGIDYDWKRYGEDNYGEFAWNTANFPDASSNLLKDTMLSKGIRLIGITKPRIVTKLQNGAWTKQGLDAQAGDYFYPGHAEYTDYFYPVTVRSIDPYKPAARDWFWQHSIDAFNKGIAGWWNDETDTVASGWANFWFGNFTTLHLSQAIYEGQRSYTNGQTRVWQTARNYYPGTQRYATTIWSGDVGTQFHMNEHIWWTAGLNEQKATMLSTINNGQMKWGSDGGGFNQNTGTTENPSPELYTRWLQLAAFTPVFRVHGTFQHQRQPWYYGFTAEESSKAAIRLRYALLPYVYSYEYKAYEKGVGLVKPLLYDYPNDPNVANYSDAWMFGDWLLVAPVTERYQTTKWIYLPAGEWIDYFTGIVYNGGQYIPYAVNGESWTDIPLFIKKGAIIPSQEVLNYADEKAVTDIFVDIFPDMAASTFNFYDDDGQTYNYENGQYFKQVFTAQDLGGSGINVSVSAKSGSYASPIKYYYLKIHGKAAQTVSINGVSSVPSYPNIYALRSGVGEGYAVGKDIYGDVTYVKIAAGAQKNVTINGSVAQSADRMTYEAEEASLWGKTVATKAGYNTNHTGYTGLGFADRFENDGAAVTFDAKVKVGGEFPVDIRYANGSSENRTMSVYVNGTFIRQVSFAPTGNWDTWGTSTQMLPLVAGRNSITIKYEASMGDTGFLNIDNISVPFYPETAVFEAESAALYGTAARKTDHWFYSGSGFVAGMESVGAEVAFKVDVPQSGSYDTVLRYCNANGVAKTLNVYVNGVYQTTANLASSGYDWNVWSDWANTFNLQKGQNTISFRFDSGNSGYVNLDSLQVNLAAPTAHVERNILDNGGFERPTWDSSKWTEWHPAGQALAYGVDSGIGTNPPEAAREGEQRAYFYHGSAYSQSIHQTANIENGVYKLEFWARQFNTAPYTARAEVMEYGGNAIYFDIPQSTEWRHYVIDNISVTTGYIDIGFYVNSPGGTTLHLDGVRLIKK